MKTMIMMVGSQGSGKTKISKDMTRGKDSLRISQDELGQKQHFMDFEAAVKSGIANIIVDKIGNTKFMRSNYLTPAKKAGYDCYIMDVTEKPSVCYERIMKRDGHETVTSKDPKTILKMLYQYYSKYEPPRKSEAGLQLGLRKFSPYMLDLTDVAADKRIITIGDVHGCFAEVEEFLNEVCYDPISDIVIFTGDLVDRGPKIKEILEFVRDNDNVYSVLGNHDNKFLRYLIGNKVAESSLSATIAQTKDMDQVGLTLMLMELPLIIKIGSYYIFHAGINPNKSMESQKRDTLLYARHFNPENGGFDESEKSEYWFKFPIKEEGFFAFGHHYHEDVRVADNVLALDGHCVFGDSLRGTVTPNHFVEVEAHAVHAERNHEVNLDRLQPYEDRVSLGLLRKQTKGDLVLYNYTDKCTYDKAWDEYTLKSRGIIFNRKTGDIVALPFKKFFNVNEMPETRLEVLPKENPEVYDKLDGSLGILYRYNEDLCVSTRGSFESAQAQVATQILHEKGYAQKIKDSNIPNTVTLLFEIIYPANRVNPSARLVVDYGSTKDLILLGAIDFKLNAEYSRELLEKTAKDLGMPISKKFNHTVEELMELRKTIPSTVEGWVAKFGDLRIKFKGDEYCKVQKIINGINPLTLWASMNKGSVSASLIESIPEEFRDDIAVTVTYLENLYIDKKAEIIMAVDDVRMEIDTRELDRETKKKIGLYVTKHYKGQEVQAAIFPFIYGQMDRVDSLIQKSIRPKGNNIQC